MTRTMKFLKSHGITVYKGLTAYKVLGNLGKLTVRNLKIIAENPVVSEFENCNPALDLLLLQVLFKQPVSVLMYVSLFIQLLTVSGKNNLPGIELPQKNGTVKKNRGKGMTS